MMQFIVILREPHSWIISQMELFISLIGLCM